MAKELIDLGIPGSPNTGDTLPVGGEKLNNHINDVYDAFSRKGQNPEQQILHSTGVYQVIRFEDLVPNTYGPIGFMYEAKPGDMLFIDVNEDTEVRIYLPLSAAMGDQVKVIANNSNTPIFITSDDGVQINLQDEIQISYGVQYQYVYQLNTALDGDWSQRIIDGSGSSSSSYKENSVVLESFGGVVTVDCSLGNYFWLQLNEPVTQFIFTNTPTGSEASTKIIRIDQEFNGAHTVNLHSLGGYWSNNTYSDELVDNTGLLALTFIGGGGPFNTWVNGWFGLY